MAPLTPKKQTFYYDIVVHYQTTHHPMEKLLQKHNAAHTKCYLHLIITIGTCKHNLHYRQHSPYRIFKLSTLENCSRKCMLMVMINAYHWILYLTLAKVQVVQPVWSTLERNSNLSQFLEELYLYRRKT